MAPDNALLIATAVRRDGELGVDDARVLFGAMLAGDVAPHELSAILAAWQKKRATLAEMTGFMRALDAHAIRLEKPADGLRPVLLPAHHGTRRQPNLTALIALLLQRYGAPVLVHGPGGTEPVRAGGDGGGAVPGGGSARGAATVDVLWELGIEPAASLADVQSRLRRENIAYVPSALLAPGLARLFAAAPRNSPPPIVHSVAMLIDPFGGEGYRVIAPASADDLAAMREFLLASRADALLFQGTEGEPFADPRGRTRLEHLAAGIVTLCADAGADGIDAEPSLPATADAPATATWISKVLAGSEPVPPPIIEQLGCCLAGARRLSAAA